MKPNPPKDGDGKQIKYETRESNINIYRFLASIIYRTRQRQGAVRNYPSDLIQEAIIEFFWGRSRNFEAKVSESGTENTLQHGEAGVPPLGNTSSGMGQ